MDDNKIVMTREQHEKWLQDRDPLTQIRRAIKQETPVESTERIFAPIERRETRRQINRCDVTVNLACEDHERTGFFPGIPQAGTILHHEGINWLYCESGCLQATGRLLRSLTDGTAKTSQRNDLSVNRVAVIARKGNLQSMNRKTARRSAETLRAVYLVHRKSDTSIVCPTSVQIC